MTTDTSSTPYEMYRMSNRGKAAVWLERTRRFRQVAAFCRSSGKPEVIRDCYLLKAYGALQAARYYRTHTE